MKTEKPLVADDQHQSQIAASLRLSEAKLAGILADTMPKNIEITFSIDPDLCSVSGDATQLHQALMNLCVKARDAMSHGGKLRIEAENVEIDEHYARMNVEARPGKYVSVGVTDTGVGIPDQNLSKIFDPFFTTKEHGHGGRPRPVYDRRDRSQSRRVRQRRSDLDSGPRTVASVHDPCLPA
jgi:signal transduction histidine kinase